MEYLPLVLLLPLVRLIVGDFRDREVPIVWLAVFAVGTVGVPIILDGWREVIDRCWQNLLLLLYLGTGIAAWGWIKARRVVNPVNVFIGLGDVLFFLALMPMFPARRFTWLMVGCTAFSLVWWWTARLRGSDPKNVPFIATSGIVIGGAIIFSVFFE